MRPRPPVGPRHPRAIRHADPRRVLRVFRRVAAGRSASPGSSTFIDPQHTSTDTPVAPTVAAVHRGLCH